MVAPLDPATALRAEWRDGSAVRLVPVAAGGDGGPPAQNGAAAVRPAPWTAVDRPGRTLAQVLLDRGCLDAATLMAALERASRGAADLGDLALREGLVDGQALLAAQADRWRARVVDLAATPPDPRLVDALGARDCVAAGVVPWRWVGSAVVVVTARPDDFARLRPRLEEVLGPVAMALATEAEVQQALRRTRGAALQALAQTRTPLPYSCRAGVLPRLRLWVLASGAALALGAVLAPAAVFAALAVLAVALLVLSTVLRIAAATAALRARRGNGSAWDSPRPAIARLPVVSILVALHGEREIAPRLLRRLDRLAWPRGLLDVILVVEEDDHPTRTALEASRLPPWMRVLPVPPGGLKTKPRALNYALDQCRGSIVGVLDAEDAPEPDQIHQVVRGFHTRGSEVACLQGVLGYYNAAETWLSRCFAVEYAVWFRLILPGLARLGLVVPLGGTTVYFRREALDAVGAWDAHNVTEDADLGLRLARHGYRTDLIPAETGEEATCRPLPWIRQRSRWLKGFAITYATHMRSPRALWRDLGPWRFFGVQVVFLTAVGHALLAPVLWSFWLLALGLGHPLEGALGLGGVVALTVLFLGAEAIAIALGVVAVSQRRDLRWLRPWVPTLHLYHPLATLAALKALWEIVVQPLYWDKTVHGRFDGAAPAPVFFAGAHRPAPPSPAITRLPAAVPPADTGPAPARAAPALQLAAPSRA